MVSVVFKDKDQKVIRSYLLEPQSKAELVLIKDTKRLELVLDTKDLDDEQVEYTWIQSLNIKDLQKSAVQVNPNLSVAILNSADHSTVQNEQSPDQQDQTIVAAFKWSSAAHASALAILMLGGWLMQKYFQEDKKPMEVVVMSQAEVEKIKAIPESLPPQQVKVAETQQEMTAQPKVPAKPPVGVKPKQARSQELSYGIKQGNYTEIGTLRTLDKIGGIGTSTAGNRKGTGFGNSKSGFFGSKSGTGGGLGSGVSGGIKNGLMGKGLVAGLSGEGSKSFGAHGYGTGKYGGGYVGRGGGSVGKKMGQILVPAFDDSEVVGGLTREQVEAVVRKNSGQLHYCYEKALQANPNLRGRITTRWVVGAGGDVRSIRITSTSMSSKDVETCVTKSILGWKFPRPVGGVSVDVSYPFDFSRLNMMAKDGL